MRSSLGASYSGPVTASLSVELTLEGMTASVPVARRFARSTLQTWELDHLIDAAALIVSELATNAVLHARSPFTVRLAVDRGGLLRLEVVDGSVRQPLARTHGAAATTGRGLSIVAELAADWGVEVGAGGKIVWVHLATRELPDSGARAWGDWEAEVSDQPDHRPSSDLDGSTALVA